MEGMWVNKKKLVHGALEAQIMSNMSKDVW